MNIINRIICKLGLLLLAGTFFTSSYAQSSDTLKLYFAFNSSSLLTDQKQSTNAFLKKYHDYRGVSIRIFGFADEPGNDSLNIIVAERRAKSLGDYLLQKGFSPQQITIRKGLGNVAPNGANQKDRRVELIVSGSKAGTRKSSEHKTDSFDCGHVFVLEDLTFAVSSSEFLPASMPTLRRLSSMLNEHEDVNVRIEGHICCGKKADSVLDVWYALSVARAKAVYDYLAVNGINKERLSFRGYGFRKPRVYPELTERDRFMNRRVEVRIICPGDH